MAVSENKKKQIRNKLDLKKYKKWHLRKFDNVEPSQILEEVFEDGDLEADKKINLLFKSLPEENQISLSLLCFFILESDSFLDLKAKLVKLFE